MDYAHQIRNILLHFDFIKVYQAMGFLNWKWAKTDGEEVTGTVPTIETLQDRAQELLIAAAAKPGGQVKQGGFSVTNINGLLTLSFELEVYSGNM